MLGQLLVSFLEKRTWSWKTISNAPIVGQRVYLLVRESMYLFSWILKGRRWAGTMLPTTSRRGNLRPTASETELRGMGTFEEGVVIFFLIVVGAPAVSVAGAAVLDVNRVALGRRMITHRTLGFDHLKYNSSQHHLSAYSSYSLQRHSIDLMSCQKGCCGNNNSQPPNFQPPPQMRPMGMAQPQQMSMNGGAQQVPQQAPAANGGGCGSDCKDPNCGQAQPMRPPNGQAPGPMMQGGMPPNMMRPGVSNPLQNVSPEQYFGALSHNWENNRVFWWREVLEGNVSTKYYEKLGVECMKSFSCHQLKMCIGTISLMVKFDFIPIRLRHLISGLFIPLMFLLFFNYNVVVGIGNSDELLKGLVATTLVLYLLVGLRGSSRFVGEKVQQYTQKVLSMRPYLNNPQMLDSKTKVLRVYRSFYCPACESVILKLTRHSLVFGIAIGAANQFLAMLFFLSLWLTQSYVLTLFVMKGSYGLLTKVMFYMLNASIGWNAFVEFATFAILNMYYGVTEQELKVWQMQHYLLQIPERRFQNNVDAGLYCNVVGSIMACLGIGGWQSQNHNLRHELDIPNVEPGKRIFINWDKAKFYVIPHLPHHKKREDMLTLLRRDQPQMIEMGKLQLKFREEVKKESPPGQCLTQHLMHQRVAIKMQQHVIKNMPQMMQPSTDQQKTIQLQMLGHMRKQFESQPDLAEQIDAISKDLQEDKVTAIEANMRMRQAQNELMTRRMAHMKEQRKKEQEAAESKKSENEEAPMASLQDEDL